MRSRFYVFLGIVVSLSLSAVLSVLPGGVAFATSFQEDKIESQLQAVAELFDGYTVHQIGAAKLYFKRDPTAELAGVGAVMMAGIGNQMPDEAHCAHMAEHMVLMHPVSNGKSLYSLASADTEAGTVPPINGHTSLDSTEYYLAVPRKDLDIALQMLIEAMFDSKVSPGAAYDAEIQRSLNEYTFMTTDDRSAGLNRIKLNLLRGTVYEEAFFETPLGDVTAEKVRGFIGREYSPARLSIVVIADCDESHVVDTLTALLAPYPPGPEAERRVVTVSPPEIESLHLSAVAKPRVLVGLAVEGVEEDDYTALSTLLQVITLTAPTDGLNGLERDPVLTLSDQSQHYAGLAVGYNADPSSSEESLRELALLAREAMRERLAVLAAGGVTDEDLSGEAPAPDPNVERLLSQYPQVYLEINMVVSALIPGRVSPQDLRIAVAGTHGETRSDGTASAGEAGSEFRATLATVAAKYLPQAKLSALYVYGDEILEARESGMEGPYPPAWLLPAAIVAVALGGGLYLRRRSSQADRRE